MSSTNNPNPSSGWRVTAIQETLKPGVNGQVLDGYNVMFTTGGGISDSVFVPKAQYNPDAIINAIAPVAATHDAVQALTVGL